MRIPNWRKSKTVAGFELAEALRSKLVLAVLTLYGLGAALGSWVFLQTLEAAENAARMALEQSLQMPADQVPPNLVREKALPGILSAFVKDDALREQLLGMDPLAMFYAFMALNLVALFILVISGGSLAADLATGSARFILTRCDRLTWLSGKVFGQAVLLAFGLLTGAAAASLVAFAHRHVLELKTVGWLLKTSLWAWIYGMPFLAFFGVLQILVRTPLAARVIGLLALFMFWPVYAFTQSSWLSQRLFAFEYFGYLFAAHYKPWLWSPHVSTFVLAAAGLLALGLAWFALGYWLFRRRDA